METVKLLVRNLKTASSFYLWREFTVYGISSLPERSIIMTLLL